MTEKELNIEEDEVKTDEMAVESPSDNMAESQEPEEQETPEKDPLQEAQEQIADLKELLYAYRHGIITERRR